MARHPRKNAPARSASRRLRANGGADAPCPGAQPEARRAEALAAAAQTFAEASLDLPAILDRVTRQVAELIGDFCAIRLLSDDREWLVTVAQYHPDPAAHALVEAVQTIPYRADEGFMGQVVQSGQALRIPMLSPDEARAGLNPALWQYLDVIGLHSLLMVPLYVHGQVIGAVGATRSTPGRPYTAEDQVFLQDLADRAALAIDHARLYAAERRARELAERAAERTGRLLAITAALSASLTPPQVAEVVLHQGIAAMGAYAGSIVLRSQDGATLEVVGMSGYPPEVIEAWHSFPADLPFPVADSSRTGEAIWCRSREVLAERYPQTLTELTEPTAAVAALPLLVDRRPIGALGLSFTEPQAFTVEDRSFMLALAQQCAQALERARLYEAERRAHAEVQEAVRIRDVFLSIASHELRTPLTSLLGNAQLIQRRAARQDRLDERDRRALGVIEAQAARLNAMVNALLDISRIETGQLSIVRAPLDLGVLVRRVVEEVQPTLARHHTIVYTAPETPLPVDGDAVRLEQVLHNLIGNAIKYSPAGGPIAVLLEQRAGLACVTIRDEGIGIPPAAIPHLFQRFYRASNADDQHISGMGIGLYVVKEILSLHGGSIDVESTEGAGSAFRLCLPLRG